jgi:hypothetical protein
MKRVDKKKLLEGFLIDRFIQRLAYEVEGEKMIAYDQIESFLILHPHQSDRVTNALLTGFLRRLANQVDKKLPINICAVADFVELYPESKESVTDILRGEK